MSHRHQSGFTLTAIIVIFLVVLLAAVAAWRVLSHRRANSTMSPPVSSSPVQQQRNTTQPPATKATDKYAGWKLYCSNIGGLCFQYPNDWSENENGSTITVTNPNQTVQVAYRPSVQGIGGHCDPNICKFTAQSITPLGAVGKNKLEVIKGIFESTDTGTVAAYHFLASDDRMTQYGLKLNQSIGVDFFAGVITSPVDGSSIEELRIKSLPDKGFSSVADANAWLNQADVVTAGDILSSSYAK